MKMKKPGSSIFTVISLALLMTILIIHGRDVAAAEVSDAALNVGSASLTESAGPSGTEDSTGRQDGERFETVIMLEGMEEIVRYEHIRNETAGFELDYDYESLERRIEPYYEFFLSRYDDLEDPVNYLKISYNAEEADIIVPFVNAALSNDFETVVMEPDMLDCVGECVRISASDAAGGGEAPGSLLTVYIIPAADGCRIAALHCTEESAEGFGARFSRILNTLRIVGCNEERKIMDEQAVSAIKQYCCIDNPELESIADEGEYPVYWEISSSDEMETVVLFRSYTGVQVRFYIDVVSGDTYVTEYIPGISTEEERTGESLNVWDYLF